jgi:hypothetical protein
LLYFQPRFLPEILPVASLRISMPELTTIYDYMRTNAALLGERILQEFPALQPFNDPVSPRIHTLLRRPFPAQTIALMGVVKRW